MTEDHNVFHKTLVLAMQFSKVHAETHASL